MSEYLAKIWDAYAASITRPEAALCITGLLLFGPFIYLVAEALSGGPFPSKAKDKKQ